MLCLAPSISTYSAAQQANEPQGTAPRIEVNVSRILVPVVVRDKHGRAVTDLKKEDFQVFDNDKPHAISGFTVELRKTREADGAAPAAPPAAAPPSSAPPERSIVFLFDDLHLSAENLMQARAAATKVLANALSPEDEAAVVSLSGRTNSGLTRDPAKLQEALANLRPHGLGQSEGFDCPRIDFYQADLIENKRNSDAINDAVRQVFNCNPGLDMKYNYNEAQSMAEGAAQRALSIGRQDIQSTYGAIAEFVRRVSKLPGQRMLVLVSPGFLPVEQDARDLESHIMDVAAESDVTISALDARGIYTTEINSDERSPGFSTMAGAGGSVVLQTGYRRQSASVAEDSMAELAAGTGGSFVHGSNDLLAGFRALTEPPECVYMIELTPDIGKLDKTYHRLKVKLDRGGVELQARRGYSLAQLLSPATNMMMSGDEVRLELVVRDAKNRPVLNLKPGEIAVTDDGSAVTLDSLRLVSGKDKAEHMVTLVFDRPPPAAEGRQGVDPSAVSQPREVAERILRVFPKSGFSFTVMDVQGRLQLQQRFTTDRKEVEQAIEAATQPANSATAVNQEEQDVMAVVRTGNGASGAVANSHDRSVARALISAINNSSRIVQDQHLQPSFAALLALAQAQQEFPERKAIVYFSSVGDKQAGGGEAIQSIISAANRAGATIYVVDLNRVDSQAAKMESSSMSVNGAPNAGAPGGKRPDSDLNREAGNNILQRLAEGTGGRYIGAEDDVTNPAKQLIDDMTTYYEASYLPTIDDYDGKFRPIAVKPLRAGLTVRSQAGYLALPAGAGATLQPFELPLLKMLGQPNSPGDVAFRSAILHMEDVPEGSVNTVDIEVPLTSLDVREDANSNLHTAHVSVVASIKDATGAVVAHFGEDFPWRAAFTGAGQANFEAITLQRHFIAPPGRYVLEAAILDTNSGKAGAKRLAFEIPGASGEPSLCT